MRTFVSLAVLAALTACSGEGKSTNEPFDPSTASGSAMPEGESAWSGTMEVGGQNFLADFELNLTGGDVRGSITFRDDPEDPAGFGEGTYDVRGTHEPTSGLLALAPYAWTETPDVESELLGFLGVYDGEAEELVGAIVDYATGVDNFLVGGPARASLVSGDGEPVAEGDGSAALSEGANTFTGTVQCTGPVRDVVLTLDYDGAGAVEGSLTVGDIGVDTPLGTYAVAGVHNPSTGGITLTPGLWTDFDTSVLTFFVHGSFDPSSGAFDGDQLTNVDACPRGTWQAAIE